MRRSVKKQKWWQDTDGSISAEGSFGIALIVLAIITILLCALIWYGLTQEDREWEDFSKKHHCRVIGKQAHYNTVGVGTNMANGMPVVTVGVAGGQTGYQCDDGMQYWR